MKAHIDRDLIVAGAAGVDLLSEVAETLRQKTLDRHVDVLIVDENRKFSLFDLLYDFAESLADFPRLVFRDDGGFYLHFRKHRHVGRGAHAVPYGEIKVENGIVADGVGQNVGVDRIVCDRLFRFCFLHCFIPSSNLRASSKAMLSFISAASSMSRSSSLSFFARPSSKRKS